MALDPAYPTASSQLETMPQWEAFFNAFPGYSAVIAGVGNGFVPSIQSGARTVTVGTGGAIVRGFYLPGPTSTATAVPTASGADRIDRLTLRLDRAVSDPEDWITLHIVQGSPGTNPIPPNITTSTADNGVWDLLIARWRSKADGSLADLVDERVLLTPGGMSFRSDARPAPAPVDFTVGFERDTGNVLTWIPSVGWTQLSQSDTGNLTLTLNSASFSSTGPNRCRKIGTDVSYELNIVVKDGKAFTESFIDNETVLMATLPSACRPAATLIQELVIDGDVFGRCVIEPDGEMRLRGTNAGISSGTGIRAAHMFRVV